MSADRYRPRSWSEVVGQPTDRIRDRIDGRNTPDFLLYGPPGTGKTTVARLIARDVQGSIGELLELNASDDRGIDVVRDEIIPTVHQPTLSGAPRVIFLDEMESMTGEAQQALRQPMEQSDATFILACNDVESVHDAIYSRCYDYEFGRLSEAAIARRVRQLAEADGVSLSADRASSIAEGARGDMRKAIQRYTEAADGATTDPNVAAAAANLMD